MELFLKRLVLGFYATNRMHLGLLPCAALRAHPWPIHGFQSGGFSKLDSITKCL